MKRALSLTAALLLLALGLPGCRKTPDKPVVLQKDLEQMLETAQSGMPAEPDGAGTVDLSARLGAPARYQAELTGANGRLRVHVDAPLTLPACELPIVRVEKREFSTDEVRHFARVLLGENAHYTADPYDNPTAGYCQKQAEKLRAAIDDWEGLGNVRYDMTYETADEARQAMNEWLARAANAPEALPAVEPDFTWQHPKVWSDAEGEIKTTDTYLYLRAMPDSATCSTLRISNSMQQAGYSELCYTRDNEKQIHSLWADDADISAFVTITQEQAYEIALQTVAALDVGDFVCVQKQRNLSDFKDWGAYGFVFARNIAGVPETYTDADGAYGSYAKSLKYERLNVLVDDGGVLQLWYDAPCTVLDTLTRQTSLMPFSDILSVFEKMVLIVDNRTEEKHNAANNIEFDYYISGVQLGLMTIAEADGTDTGLLIPVWDFLGCLEYESDLEGHTVIYRNERHAFLTVNAVDGTIIDRAQGY